MKTKTPIEGENDGSNCGTWVLMDMFNRKKDYTNTIGSHTHEQSAKLYVDLIQLLLKIYELIAEKIIGCLNGKIMVLLKINKNRCRFFHLQLIPNLISIKGGIICQRLHLPPMKSQYVII